MTRLRVCSLFSGIGGLDLGLENAGHKIVLQTEIDPHCQQVLRKNFPGTVLLNDVSHVLPSMLHDIDLLVAGFPCNDCSTENQQRPGLRQGSNTREVSHVFRLLEGTKVPWVLLENVTGLLKWHRTDVSTDQPPGIDYICTELECLGYRWAYRVVDLCSFGVPQRRRRVFIIGSLYGDPRDVLLSQNAACQGQCISLGNGSECYNCFYTPPLVSQEEIVAAIDLGEKRHGPLQDVCHCFTTSNCRRTCILRQPVCSSDPPTLYMLHVHDAERLMGFPAGFTEAAFPLKKPFERMPVFDTNQQTYKRLSLLGIACAVQQSQWLGEQLAHPCKHKFNYGPLSTQFTQRCPGASNGDTAWPPAAYNILLNNDTQDTWLGRMRVSQNVSDAPMIRAFIPLGKFLEYKGVAPSAALCQGYLQRLELGHEIDDTVRRAMEARIRDSDSHKLLEQDAPEVSDCTFKSTAESLTSEEATSTPIANAELDEHGMPVHGKCMWVKWRVSAKNGSIFWPCIAMHPVQDYAYIPSEALADRSAKLSPEYRLLIFFGDRKFSWKRAGQLFSFAEYYNEAMKQPIFGMKDEFERALQHARSWSNARTLGQPLDPITTRNVTTLLKVPNICGTCAVCIKDTAQKRSGPQVVHNTRLKNGSDVSHLVNDLKKGCPQLDVIELARAGHVGATLAMRKHAAEGQRLMVHWPSDGKFYAGEITSFDALTYTFRIDYDDGDVEQESKLWQETVVLVVSSMDGDQACTKVQNAHEAFKLQKEAKYHDSPPISPKTPDVMRRDAFSKPVLLKTSSRSKRQK